jgi:hypothetical protein
VKRTPRDADDDKSRDVKFALRVAANEILNGESLHIDQVSTGVVREREKRPRTMRMTETAPMIPE